MTESNTTRKRNGNRLSGERESAIISRSAAVIRQERNDQVRKGKSKNSSSASVKTTGKASGKNSGSRSSSGSYKGQAAVRTNQKQREREVLLRLRVILAASIVLCVGILIRLMTSEPQEAAKAETSVASTLEGIPEAGDAFGEASIEAAGEAADQEQNSETASHPAQITPARTLAEIYLEENKGDIPSRTLLEADSILQEPELPTGCESVALTMALNSLGYDLEKTTIADEYLVYSDFNLILGYVGDPHAYDGAGVYPHGLALSANRFLQTNGHSQVAYDITGTDFDDLLVYLAGGYPVVIWSTIGYEDVEWSNDTFEYQGESFRWYWNEHCVMLQGYDLDEEKCYILDPLEGEVEIGLDKMRSLYTEIGKYAVVIM